MVAVLSTVYFYCEAVIRESQQRQNEAQCPPSEEKRLPNIDIKDEIDDEKHHIEIEEPQPESQAPKAFDMPRQITPKQDLDTSVSMSMNENGYVNISDMLSNAKSCTLKRSVQKKKAV